MVNKINKWKNQNMNITASGAKKQSLLS